MRLAKRLKLEWADKYQYADGLKKVNPIEKNKYWYRGEYWIKLFTTPNYDVYVSKNRFKRLYVFWDGTHKIVPAMTKSFSPKIQTSRRLIRHRKNPQLLIVNPLSKKEAIKINEIPLGSYLIDDPKKIGNIYMTRIYDSSGLVDIVNAKTKKEVISEAKKRIKLYMGGKK